MVQTKPDHEARTITLSQYTAAVAPVLVCGCEARHIMEKVTKWTRDGYLVPPFDIVARIRAKRLAWVGHYFYLGKRKNICREE